MEGITASVFSTGGTVLLKDARVQLQSNKGTFSVPLGSGIDPGGFYRLLATDGRSGEIIISGFSAGSDREYATVRFEVSGVFGK